jgi:hypothetical protein
MGEMIPNRPIGRFDVPGAFLPAVRAHAHLEQDCLPGKRVSLWTADLVDEQAATHYRAIWNDSLPHVQRGDACGRHGEYVSALTEYRKALVCH